MKFKLAFIFVLLVNSLLSQIPEKDEIMKAYYAGYKAFEAVQNQDKDLIEDYFKETDNLLFLTEGMEHKIFQEDSIKIREDIMYNSESKNFEFLVYGGLYVPTEDDWGLFDYYFVVEIEIDLTKDERKDQIIKTNIIKNYDDEKELMNWWRAYMRSYKDPIYLRKKIADDYNLIPPPPPPPGSTSWF